MRQREAIDCPFVPVSATATNDPEPVDDIESNSEETSTTDEPPEPGDIDRESR